MEMGIGHFTDLATGQEKRLTLAKFKGIYDYIDNHVLEHRRQYYKIAMDSPRDSIFGYSLMPREVGKCTNAATQLVVLHAVVPFVPCYKQWPIEAQSARMSEPVSLNSYN
jgi:hypothetical protein